ncbi:PREDICTED: SEC14-like protein 2 [Papilio polytes]|uniref:SEC14-like protein 2 n=1 Tax=Papilio polytes TaxID=76194 RepID=UPI0006764BC4|nr:PREDICTED: SEC14-like protein 2 [Papilio polytes]
MAPMSNTVVGIDDDQRFALMKFRRSVRDVLKPEHNDHYLLRWLRARQWNPEAAEKMLRDSLIWREKWGIDTTLDTWKAPEALEKHFPSGTTGFDKEGSPVIIVPFVGLDVWGLLHSVSRTDVIRMILRHLENYLASARKQSLVHGPDALKVTVLFDLEGFNIRQYAWKPAAEMVFTLLQIYEANYPEILKTCFIVNAPKVFSLAFSVIKKFMHEYTISKIQIYGTEARRWQAAVLAAVDGAQLPAHYGGELLDDNGDPRCSLMVKPGGKVPKSYYSKNASSEQSKEYKRVTVKTGEKHSIDLLCMEEESVLKWEFGVDSHDIKFVIKRRDAEGAESVVHGPRKVPAGAPDLGFLPVSGPATYSVIFDNKSAYLRNKKVFYDVLISVPEKDLNMSDEPEDAVEATESSEREVESARL